MQRGVQCGQYNSRAGDNSNGIFFNELDLIKILLRYAAKDDWAVVKMRLYESEV